MTDRRYAVFIVLMCLVSFAVALPSSVVGERAVSESSPGAPLAPSSGIETGDGESTLLRAAGAEESPTPTSTSTEEPTPSATPSATMTATPTLPATSAAESVFLPMIQRGYLPPTPTPTPTATPILEFCDDFSDPESGWVEDETEEFIAGYYEGEYRILVKEPNTGGGTAHELFSCEDCDIDVDMRFANDIPGAYGIMFGATEDGESLYMLLVQQVEDDELSYYALFILVGGELEVILDWTEYAGVNLGQEVNHLRLFRDGLDVGIYINGEHVVTFYEDTIVGDLRVGVVAGGAEAGVDARFDNFCATKELSSGSSAFCRDCDTAEGTTWVTIPRIPFLDRRAAYDQDPGEPGPYEADSIAVTTTNEDTGSELDVDIYYPSKDGDVDPARARYPGLVFSPGMLSTLSSYPLNGQHLASWGYIVAIPTFPDDALEVRVSDVRHLLTYLETEHVRSESVFYQRVDTSRLAVAGHSLGGTTTMITAARDQRVKAAVALDPVNPADFMSGGAWDFEEEAPNISAPLAVIGAPSQFCNYFANYNDMYPEVGSCHKAKYVLANGSHCDFVHTDPGLQRDACYLVCGGRFNEDRTLLVERYTTAWLNYYLLGQVDQYSYLYGLQSDEDVQAGQITKEADTAPRNVAAQAYADRVELQWDACDEPGVDGYNVYRRLEGEAYSAVPLARLGKVSAFSDVEVLPGQLYYYALRSRDAAGNEHELSDEVSAEVGGTTTPTSSPTMTLTPSPTGTVLRTYLPCVFKS